MRCSDGNSLLTQQKEFTVRESEHSLALNDRNAEIKSLTARVINLEAKVKISEKENEILRSKARELEETLNDRENAVQSLRSRGSKTEHEWESRLEQ
jgi:chromosome segregation ATPase